MTRTITTNGAATLRSLASTTMPRRVLPVYSIVAKLVVAMGLTQALFAARAAAEPQRLTEIQGWGSSGLQECIHDCVADLVLVRLGDRILFVPPHNLRDWTDLWISDGSHDATTTVCQLTGVGRSDSDRVRSYVLVDRRIVFTLGFEQPELWMSDGTREGTREISHIVPGVDWSSVRNLTAVGSQFFFWVEDSVHGYRLWVSDGTSEGTALVSDTAPGTSGYPIYEPRIATTAVGDRLVFTAWDGETGVTLWVSDGTSGGTARVFAKAGTEHYDNDGVRFFTAVEDLVFVVVEPEPGQGTELWASDGTPEGSEVLQRFSEEAPVANPRQLTAAGDRLFLAAWNPERGYEVWVSDGTPDGTVPVKGDFLFPWSLTAVGNRIFFTDGVEGELWVSDGTPAGTVQFADYFSEIFAGPEGSTVIDTHISEDRLLVKVRDRQNDESLWVTDGTREGTILWSETPVILEFADGPMAFAGEKLYFSASDPVHGRELWVSDGTAEGTRIVRDLAPGVSTDIDAPVVVGDRIVFGIREPVGDPEVWVSDGSRSGTMPLREVAPNLEWTSFGWPTVVDTRLFFTATNAEYGEEIWVTEGGIEQAILLADIVPGADSSEPGYLTTVGDRVFFAATDSEHGYELWVSDGTLQGTTHLTDIVPGAGSSNPGRLTAVGDQVFFCASDSEHGRELWVSDGTPEGARLVEDIFAGPESSSPLWLAAVGDRLFFSADSGRRELWVSDGTPQNTWPLGPDGGYLVAFGERVVFYSNYSGKPGIWVSDGTPLRTTLLKSTPWQPGLAVWPPGLVVVQDSIFLSAPGGLWSSDGTPEGTRLVSSIPSGNPRALTVAGDTLYFGAGSSEIWTSDGTESGTVLLEKLSDAVSPRAFKLLNDRLVFSAEDPDLGGQIWSLDLSNPLPSGFLRGDCNDDGTVDISDAIFSLESLFLDDGDPSCDDGCDSNDDGTVDISDAIATLGVLFLGNKVIPLPGMTECGVDPTDDGLDCMTFGQCP